MGKQICKICNNRIKKPVLLNCGHAFCASCVYDFLKNNTQCPICQKNIIPSKIIYIFPISEQQEPEDDTLFDFTHDFKDFDCKQPNNSKLVLEECFSYTLPAVAQTEEQDAIQTKELLAGKAKLIIDTTLVVEYYDNQDATNDEEKGRKIDPKLNVEIYNLGMVDITPRFPKEENWIVFIFKSIFSVSFLVFLASFGMLGADAAMFYVIITLINYVFQMLM